MPRHLFGLSPADVATEKVGDDLKVRPGATGAVYLSLTGGTQVTDLTTPDGTAVSEVTADADGRVGFYGPDGDPDGPTLVFVDFGYGRFAMAAIDTGSQLVGKVNRDGDTMTGNLTVPGFLATGDAAVQGRLDVAGGIYSAGTLLTPGSGGGSGGGTSFSLGSYTHIVYQSAGRTIARRADGASVSDLPTTAANNRTVIQAAIDDANTRGVGGTPGFAHYPGGHVLIDRGVYDIPANTSIVAKYGVAISGVYGSWYDRWNNAGTFGTMLRANGAGTSPLIQVGILASGSRLATNPHGIWIQSLVLQGNARAGDGIDFNDVGFIHIEDIYVRDCNVAFHWRGQLPGTFDGTMDQGVHRCVTKACNMAMDTTAMAPSTYTGTDMIMSNCRFMSSIGTQVRARYGGWQFMNCHFTHGNSALHLDIDGADTIQINSNYFDSGNAALCSIKTSFVSTFVGNICIIEGAVASVSGAAVEFPWGRCTAIGNTLRPNTGYSGLKGFIATGTPSQGVIFGNITGRRTGATGWVSDVVTMAGAAVADRNDGGSYIAGNKNWVI